MKKNNFQSTPHRPRGAPLGNANAVKHGFYSRRLKKRELQDLDVLPPNSLIEEVALLRIFIRRAVERSKEQNDLLTTLAVLRALSLASDSISRLLRTQVVLHQQENQTLLDQISAIVSDVARELCPGLDEMIK